MKENSTFKETTIEDYIPLIKEKFPTISELDIRVILKYGWRLLYLANLSGCDTLITSTTHKFWFYIGSLGKNSLKHFEYYKNKLIRKILFLYKRIKPEWDGYYYTAISNEDYLNYFTPRRGRKRVNYTLSNKLIFKSKDACTLYYSAFPYIIKFKHIIDVGFKKYYTKLILLNPEIVTVKDVSNFKDVLVDNNDYDLI